MIVIFTDFGVSGPYIGQMKAVLHRLAPGVDVVDLFTDAPVFDPRAAAYLLSAYTGEFPQGTVFLCVVDPGVGSDRAAGILGVDGKWFVGPDNGIFAILARRSANAGPWMELSDIPAHVSATFHGRDVFAPAAAWLATGKPPACVEKPLSNILRPQWPDDLAQVVYIDGFGNAMTGLRASTVNNEAVVAVCGVEIRRARTFSDVAPGQAFWYENSNGLLEIAVNCGRADEQLGAHIGATVLISGK
ncbi:MAG: SAM-dependent chlorinase/fluorinase [Rhodospirillales bacterium]|nr:SAM-dependent chlorinase/fluorinase [Rhodospirillales bacterium]